MKFKKFFCSIVLFLSLVSAVNADDLSNLLQDLAMQTACIGMYSTAQTGVLVTSRYDDPKDWYDPPMMANRFAAMSGNKTRTETFYGVCFDYAQFAWDDIKKYQAAYNKAGMKNQEWYIAGANAGDPHTIILYDPVPQEKATTILNGVYLKEHSRQRVYTHDGATGHAWLWVQHKNGTWYWIDPTWTDNTGYVWWGLVQNGKEVQFYPDPYYCRASNYPSASNTGTHSTASTYTEYRPAYTPTYTQTARRWLPAFILCYSAPFDFGGYGLSLSIEEAETKSKMLYFPFSVSFDFISIENAGSFLLGTAVGYPVLNWLVIYAGGGVGLTMDNNTYENEDDVLSFITWKMNGGLRFIPHNPVFLKLDVSYGTIMGPSFGVGVGLGF